MCIRDRCRAKEYAPGTCQMGLISVGGIVGAFLGAFLVNRAFMPGRRRVVYDAASSPLPPVR